MYSSIQKKYSVCIDCKNGIEVPVIAERCSYHYKIHRAIIQMDRQKERNKIRSLNQLEGNKKMAEAKINEKIVFSGIEEWYKMVADVIEQKPYCWNCGLPISKSDYRNASAHILFKSLFPSVATHPLNFIVAGNRCGCHSATHRMDTFSEMSVFPLAVKRFWEFEPLITEHHKILETFKEYANQL